MNWIPSRFPVRSETSVSRTARRGSHTPGLSPMAGGTISSLVTSLCEAKRTFAPQRSKQHKSIAPAKMVVLVWQVMDRVYAGNGTIIPLIDSIIIRSHFAGTSTNPV